jgi:hypothetical protein
MDHRQQNLAHVNAQITQLINQMVAASDALNETVADWEAASEAQRPYASQRADDAEEAYHTAAQRLSQHIKNVWQYGYRLSWGE